MNQKTAKRLRKYTISIGLVTKKDYRNAKREYYKTPRNERGELNRQMEEALKPSPTP